MGAEFNTMTADGDLTRDQLKRKFDVAQDADRYENGHSYSGGFGMARGLSFRTEIQVFQDAEAASEWLQETAEKWENAIAVRYKAREGKIRWMIGAWCAC